jgi:hypothetical protein
MLNDRTRAPTLTLFIQTIANELNTIANERANSRKEKGKKEKDLKVNLNIFKNHYIHHHVIDSIRSKGPICNTDTGYGEARHPQTKVDFLLSNRHPNEYEMQVSFHII